MDTSQEKLKNAGVILPEDLPITKEDVTHEENKLLEQIKKTYLVFNIPQGSALKEKLNTDTLRIYDKDIIWISRFAEIEYHKEKNRLKKDHDILTYGQTRKDAIERGDWSEVQEKEIEDMIKECQTYFQSRDYMLAKFLNLKEGEQETINEELKKLDTIVWMKFSELEAKVAIKTVVFSGCLEVLAQERLTIAHLVGSVCWNKEDMPENFNPGNRVWKTINEFEESYYRQIDLEELIRFANEYWRIKISGEIPFFEDSPEGTT